MFGWKQTGREVLVGDLNSLVIQTPLLPSWQHIYMGCEVEITDLVEV